VLNIPVSKVVLQRAGIVAIIGELVAAGMAQHVRMDRERHPGGFPEALHEPMEADRAHWSTTLRNKHVGTCGVLAPQLTQGSHFITTDRVDARDPTLRAMDVHPAFGQLDLMPLQVTDFRGPKTVAIGDQDHGGIAMAVTAVPAGAIHKSLDFFPGEVSTRAAIWNCQVYSG
jgi:hypothetical protein